MKTLLDLKTAVDELLEEHPEWSSLPLMYSTDDEGNNYHMVNDYLTPAMVADINEYYLEMQGYLDSEKYTEKGNEDGFIEVKDINCICIN